MRKIILSALLLLAATSMGAQTYTRKTTPKQLQKALKWEESGNWRNGFTKASPDTTVNVVDFREQYKRNKKQWQALFRWLQQTDLLALTPGKHPIPGSTLVASVQDDYNKPVGKRGSESHRKKIDFQYVVRGTEGFALLDHESSTPNCEYNAQKYVIHYDYDSTKLHKITNNEDCFNIFFPSDWHIAKASDTQLNEPFRVIVVKVDYKEK